jgi:tRNA nucleotidyltransferase/poly(A) polymerase
VVLLSESAPRVVRVAGKRSLDIAEIVGADLGEDLARRDFTANAMALELSSASLVDPHGGFLDLARRRLRLVRPGNLEEDPLRVLRAARFFATHGLAPDTALTAACRAAAPLLAGTAPERIAVELARLLEAPRTVPALAWAARAGVLAPALDRSLPPGFSRRLSRLDAAAVRREDPPARRLLRLALLADSLGLSSGEVSGWLAGRRFPGEWARRAARLIELARVAASLAPGEDWLWVVTAAEEGRDALRLLPLLWPHSRVAGRLRAKIRSPRPRVRVSGGDILEWTGIAPGPAVGELLRRLEVEIRRGAVRTRRQARSWALAAAAATSPRPPTR